MASSRIFVRGLPPSVREDDLKRHFDKFDPKDPSSTTLTDAHFIPHRRIGYVGYKTPEAAARAVKYFNKSFIRMSKIVAEIARPVDEQERARKRRKVDKSSPDPSEKPLVVVQEPQQDERLARFVDTMQSTSRGNTWSNQDVELQAKQPSAVQEGESLSDDEYQTIDKKPVSQARQESMQAPNATESRNGNTEDPSKQPMSGEDDEQVQVPAQGDPTAKPPVTSDLDWLRSRTSRVLDFLDDGDVDLETQRRIDGPKEPDAPEAEDQTINDAIATTSDAPEKSKDRTDPVKGSAEQPPSGRLLVRNLLYETTDEELLDHFRSFGSIDEVHVCRDTRSGKSKGFAFVQFEVADQADEARLQLSGKPFQGRNLHIEPAIPKRDNNMDEIALAKLPFKVQSQIGRKAGANAATFNSLYMSADAVMASVATRLGVSKSDVLDPTSADAAVQQAHAETKTIQDTQSYFKKHGVDLDAFKQARRGGSSDTVILVKNFPFGTTASELQAAFEKHGAVKRLLIPPTATIAILEMEQPAHAKAAFRSLAYSKFRDSVLLLEKAPKSIFRNGIAIIPPAQSTEQDVNSSDEGIDQEFEEQEAPVTSSLFADKLPWTVTTEKLRELFRTKEGFLSARVMTRSDPKKPGMVLSRGFGFVEFRSKAQAKAAMQEMSGHMLDGQQPLILRPSHRTTDAAEERRKEDRDKKLASQGTKIVVKNLPFEATQKDVRALCSPYGQLRSVRLPKKMDYSSRGFAFVDFISAKEAANAMDALKNTHLLGRRLVLDFAATDMIDPEEEIARMQQKVERQADKVANQKLTAGGRTKFRAHDQDGEGVE